MKLWAEYSKNRSKVGGKLIIRSIELVNRSPKLSFYANMPIIICLVGLIATLITPYLSTAHVNVQVQVNIIFAQ